MTQSTLSIRIDSDDKKEFEEFCDEVEADPFYSKPNMNRLANAVADAKAGKNMTEHELIEVD